MVGFFIWVVGILFVSQLLILLQLIGWKTSQLKKQERIAAEITRLRPELQRTMRGELEEIPIITLTGSARTEAAESILDELNHVYEGEDALQAIRRVAEEYLTEPYKKILKRSSWADRINTLYFIDDFSMMSLKEEVYAHLLKRKKRDEEYRQCLRNSISFGDGRVLSHLFNEPLLSVVFLKELLLRMDANLLAATEEMLETDREEHQNMLFAFITVNGELNNSAYFPFVEKMLEDPREEVRIKAMKSLCSYREFTAFALLERFSQSSSWQERMYSAKLIGACKLEGFRGTLTKLISDKVWWVRFAAAENITQLDGGEELLRRIHTASDDAYARDIAAHMLVRKGGSVG